MARGQQRVSTGAPARAPRSVVRRYSRTTLYRRLAGALREGFHITVVLDLLRAHEAEAGLYGSAAVKAALRAWSHNMAAGLGFAQAVRGWLPDGHVRVLEAGEQADSLPSAIDDCIALDVASARMRAVLSTMFVYPLFIASMIAALFVFYGLYVMPRYVALLPYEEWRGVARSMPVVFDFVIGGGLAAVVVGVIAACPILAFVLRAWTSPLRGYVEWLPPFSIYRLWHGVIFLLSLSAFLRSGIPITDAFRRMADGAPPWLAAKLYRLIGVVREGGQFGEAFWRADRSFPDPHLNIELRVVGDLSDFDARCPVLAAELLARSLARLEKIAKLVRELGVLLNMACMAWLVVAVMSLAEQFQKGF